MRWRRIGMRRSTDRWAPFAAISPPFGPKASLNLGLAQVGVNAFSPPLPGDGKRVILRARDVGRVIPGPPIIIPMEHS